MCVHQAAAARLSPFVDPPVLARLPAMFHHVCMELFGARRVSPSAATGTCGTLLLWAWLGPVTLDDCAAFRETVAEHARRHPEGFVELVLVRPDVPAPSDDVRLALLGVRRSAAGAGLLAEAIVYESVAWPRGRTDSVSSGLGSLSSELSPQRVCDDVEEAMQWLRSKSLDAPPPSGVGAAVSALRAASESAGD